MKTKRQEMEKAVEACFQLCTKYKAEKVKKELIKSSDVVYLEQKLLRIIKSLDGSRYKDLRTELIALADIVEVSSKSV